MCSSGTLMLALSTYKAGVGRFSCQCGTAPRVFPYSSLRTKPCGLGSPKRTNKLVGGQEQNPPPQKGAFEGSAHQEYCPLWGGVGLACPRPDTHTILLPLCKARLYHYYTVWEDSGCSPTSAREAPHSCLISAWRKHECITTTHASLRTKPCGLGSLKRTNKTSLRVARNKMLPHSYYICSQKKKLLHSSKFFII